MNPPERGAIAEFCVAVARRFHDDRGIQTAGSLTFTTLLAIVPLVTVALSLSTVFPVFNEAIDALEQFLLDNLLPDTAGIDGIATQISAFTEKAGRLTAIGLAFLAVTALMLILTIDEVFNRIFRVTRRRALAQRLVMYWSVLTLGPVLMGGSISMTSFLVGSSLGVIGDLGSGAQLALGIAPFLFTWAAFSMLYLLVPNRRIDPWHAMIGGIAAALLFEAAKRLFAFYIVRFPTYTLIYGAFATLPIFLLWLYISWMVVLLGATITAMLPAYRDARSEQQGSPGRDLLDALRVLATLARAQATGRVPSVRHIAAEARMPPYRCERVLERCAELGWTTVTERDGWLLAREAVTIRIADVYRAFVLDPEAHGADLSGATERLSGPLAEHWKHVDADLDQTLREFAREKETA